MTGMRKEKLLCLVGPTASGKTALAVDLALAFGLEVVSCDSMQVYRGLDVGTAKPSPVERRGVPHHMLDVANPDEHYSAARYAGEAGLCLADIASRGGRALVAGGTGLYLRALTTGLHSADNAGLPAQEDDPRTNAALHAALHAVDPETAMRLPPGDRRRILRALEVHRATGRPLSAHHLESRETPPPAETAVLGLLCEDRQALYRRINARVEDMLTQGLREEVGDLLHAGLPPHCTAMQAIGYKEMAAHLRGECSLRDAAEAIKQNTRRLAKRQLTWFRHQEDVHWLEASDPNLLEKAGEFVGNFILP